MFRHACRFPFMAEIFREKLGIDIATAGISLRDFAAALEDLPLVAPSGIDTHLSAQYHPVWDWAFDRVITLNVDQIGLNAALNALERSSAWSGPSFPRMPPSVRCAARTTRCRRSSKSPARSRTTASSSAASAASRAGRILGSPLIDQLVANSLGADLGRTDLFDSAGTLFRDMAEPVA